MKKPKYLDIYEQFKKMIFQGLYQENQKLPSKRKLADNLKVSPLTVEAAYMQLIAEGYIYAIEKRGYFVAKRVELMMEHDATEHSFSKPKDKEQYAFNFETNVVDTTLFPNATWAKLSREVISENHHEMLNQTPPQGLLELRLEIAKYLELYRQINIHPEQIIIGSGSTSLISMLVELLGRHLNYAVEQPGYKKIEQLLKAQDVNLDYAAIDRMGLSVDHLMNKKIDVIHVTPSHQFPTGIVMPISRRAELLNWALEHHAYIIEDDYDSEFRFQGKPIPALQGLDQNDRVIYMNTFSKSLAPSFRISYMVIPRHLLSRYHEMSSYHSCTVPTFEQYVLYKFMNGGYFERHINRMRNHYREKLEMIRDLMSSEPWIKLHGDEAGLHFLMELEYGLNEEEIEKRLHEHHLHAVVLNKKYRQLLYEHPCLVIGYSGLQKDEIKKAFNSLLQSIKPLI
ncbi:MAG: PLP-dependent aminotransferase family protein [Acholeplasmataceae bacterium]